MQRDDECTAADLEGDDVRQARAVALGRRRTPERGKRVRCRKSAAVGKGDALAQSKGVDQAVLADGVGRAQARQRRELFIQRKQPLIEQRAERLLHAVGAGDGIECLAGENGQREGGDLHRYGLLRRALLRLLLPELLRLVLHRAGTKTQRQRQHKCKAFQHSYSLFHGVREITAIWLPRAVPIRRWDQNRSLWQAVQSGWTSTFRGSSPPRSSHSRLTCLRST